MSDYNSNLSEKMSGTITTAFRATRILNADFISKKTSASS